MPAPPAMLRPALLALAASALSACGGGGPPRSAILITLDTTRADALGAYGGGAASLTPALDRLAAEGVLFESAYATAPITLPSHASMLTGLYPPRHTLRDNGLWALPRSASTLAERASAAGAATAAFLGAVVLDRGFGLDQGFGTYDVPRRRGPASSHAAERPAGEVTAAALAWLAARDRERPFFLWLHLFDPHAPYAPPPAFRGGGLSPYAGEVAATDRALAGFLDALRAGGVLEHATLLVVADHGEGLGEHGEATHGTHCFESTLRVPLLLRPADAAPGPLPARGARETAIVSVADVAPTLLEALGLAVPAGLDGRSLFDPAPERGVYFESYSGHLSFGWSPIAGWVSPEGKYVHSSAPELYDLARDPGETQNLIGERDPRPWRLAIAEVLARPVLSAEGAAADPELLAELRGLGYAAVDGGARSDLPSPLAPGDGKPPRETIAEHALFLRAMDLSNAGAASEAVGLLEDILASNPRNHFARELYAFDLQALGRTGEALGVLETLVRERPERPNAWANLGRLRLATGDAAGAVEALERAVGLAPRDPRHLRSLVEALRAAGRDAGALEERLRGLGA